MASFKRRVFFAAAFASALPFAICECIPGTRKVGANNDKGFVCEQCPEGTFSDKPDMSKCELCTTVQEDSHHLLIVSPCNRGQDTVVQCIAPGFYYRKDLNSCQPCTQCEEVNLYTLIACSHEMDAVCCPNQDMELRDGKCTKPMLHCSEKEHLIRHVDGSDACKPCPADSTNFNKRHRKQNCEECLNKYAHHVKERAIFCADDEVYLGQSCTGRAYVMCDTRNEWGAKLTLLATASGLVTFPFLTIFCIYLAWFRFVRVKCTGYLGLASNEKGHTPEKRASFIITPGTKMPTYWNNVVETRVSAKAV